MAGYLPGYFENRCVRKDNDIVCINWLAHGPKRTRCGSEWRATSPAAPSTIHHRRYAVRNYPPAISKRRRIFRTCTEPPYWYDPVRRSLGAALLRASLARTPSNGWALSGLTAVYRERGDRAALAAVRERCETTCLVKPQGPASSAL